jgi:hypothetical protein
VDYLVDSDLTRHFLVGKSPPTSIPNNRVEPCQIHALAFVVPERVFVDVEVKVEGIDLVYVRFRLRLTKYQKFSMPLVWSSPETDEVPHANM